MAYIVFCLGVVLAGCGGYALYSGFDDLTTERGLALTLSGTVGLSIGLVVVAISFGLFFLGRISRKLDELKTVTADLASELNQAMALPKETESQVLSAVEDAVFAEALQAAPDTPPSLGRSEPTPRTDPSHDPMLETVLGLEDNFGLRPVREAKERPTVASNPTGSDAASRSGGLSSLGRASAGIAAAGIVTAGVAAAATLAEDEAPAESETTSPAETNDIAAEPPAAASAEQDFMGSQADINRLIEELSISDMSGSAHPDTVNPDFAKVEVAPSETRQEPSPSFDVALLEELGTPTPASTPEHPIIELKSDPAPIEDEPPAPLPSVPALENEVIGSYESAGVTYTLYADGSVVAEAGQMRETYASLEALRAAFERGESVFSV